MTTPYPNSRSTSLSLDRFNSNGDRRHSSSSKQQRPQINDRPIVLWTHEPPNFSSSQVVLNPEFSLPSLSESDLLQVSFATSSKPNTKSDGHKRGFKNGFVFKPSQAFAHPDLVARQPQLQLSLSKNIAANYGFYNRAEAVLKRVSREENTIDHVELYFRDQYIGRADMWRFFQKLEDTCVYCGQKIVLAGSVRATIGRIFIKEKKVTSGYVAASTKAIFRSESAKYNLFIQLSREMWEFDEDGEIYYEKALQGFIPELLKRWRSIPTNHVLSVILFARVHYDESEVDMVQGPLRHDSKARSYIDYYKVVVDLESNCDWDAVMIALKEEFFRFQHDILLLRRPTSPSAASKQDVQIDLLGDCVHMAGRLSLSYEGNLLEAINLALNPFDEHYIDRDLNRTGFNMVFVTAGTGHFEVDKRLLRLTTERMIENGIALDLVCLTKMPLHSVPLFHFKSHYPDQKSQFSQDRRHEHAWSIRRGLGGPGIPSGPKSATPGPLISRRSAQRLGTLAFSTSAPIDPLYFDSKKPSHEEEDFYSMPHWVDCSFYNLQQDKPFRADRFVPRCKMYEVQMMGIMENQISDIAIPFLDLKPANKPSSVQSSLHLSRQPGPSDFAFVSDPATSGMSDLALTGLPPKEQRRLARERFDYDTFKDVDPHHKAPRKQTATTIDSPANSDFQPSFDRPALKRAQSSGYGNQNTPLSSVSPVKPPLKQTQKASKLSQEGTTALSILELKHGKDPSPQQARHSYHSLSTQSTDNRQTTHSRPVSQLLSRSPSRPASIRSTGTFPRGVRPLEPVGKAKALVASTDAVLSATSYTLDSETSFEKEETAKDDSASASKEASANKATASPHRKGKGYIATWFWKSLTGVSSSKDSDPSTPISSKGLAMTPATRRIQEVLNSQLRSSSGREKSPTKRSVNSPGILSRTASLLSVHEAAGPAPIRIPSQMTPRTRQEAEVEERIFRDQDAYEQQLEEEEAQQQFAQRAQVEKQILVNPSNPSKNLKTNSSQFLRWQHLFPRRLNHHAVKWRSMTTPACLPLTTLYLPTESDLAAMWNEHPHSISVTSETDSFFLKKLPSTHPALAVLREMAYHRLAQGYQFIVPANKLSPTASSRKFNDPKHFSLRWPSELLQPGNLSTGNPIFLSMSNQIHRISYDRSAGTINIKRYVRKIGYSTDSFDYACCIWSRHLPGYQTVKATFRYPDSASYNWTYLDAVIAGYSDEGFVESLRYWRARFVLVPAEGSPPPVKAPSGEDLDDEEIRLIGTDKLAELFHRARYIRNKEDKDLAIVSRFLPTSLDPAMSLHDEDFVKQLSEEVARQKSSQYSPSSSKKRSQKPLSGRSLDLIAKDMRSNGLVINDRLWHRMIYSDTFTGADFVNWLCQEYSDVRTREEAIEGGIRLMKEGLFEHVLKVHGFLDGHYFYRLRGEYAGSKHGKSWFRVGRSGEGPESGRGSFGEKDGKPSSMVTGSDSRRNTFSESVEEAPRMGHSRQSSQNYSSASLPKKMRKIQLSQAITIDVDPAKKSDRAEIAFLHYDLAHNPTNGFNFQIHWLGTTARFIEDVVQNWTRTLEKYGLRLIEAPIGQVKDVSEHNPFQTPLHIELSLPPPHPSTYAHRLPANAVADQYFEYNMLRRWGFVLDQEASHRYPKDIEIVYSSRPSEFEYSQFVHRSGVAFVQVLGGKSGFLWLNNRLFNSHLQLGHRQQQQHSGKVDRGGGSVSHHAQTPDADRVRREFTEFCSDPIALEKFYRKVLAQLFEVEKEAEEQQRIREEQMEVIRSDSEKAKEPESKVSDAGQQQQSHHVDSSQGLNDIKEESAKKVKEAIHTAESSTSSKESL